MKLTGKITPDSLMTLEAYAKWRKTEKAGLIPDGSNWKATMMIEYPDVEERKVALSRLIGIEDKVYVEVEGQPRIFAIADEDLDRENDEKTSAVHFLRFEFSAAAREAVKAGVLVAVGCTHPNYSAHQPVPAETLLSLSADLR